MRDGGAIGILYAEEFGNAPQPSSPPSSPRPPPPRPPPAPPPPLTQRDIDAACERAVDAARLGWAQTDEARRTAALETLAAGLSEVRDEAANQAETHAEAIARTALAAVAAVLPELGRTHGDAEVRALLRALLPQLAHAGPIVVRVHPGLIEPIRADVDALADTLGATIELRPANLAPGDARLSWPDGTLVRDAGAIRGAVIDGLAQLGLLEPIQLPGTPEYAE